MLLLNAALLAWVIALPGLLAGDPGCADEAWRRQVLAQARLFELHDTEEKFRAGLAQELGGCAPGPAGAACRSRAESRSQGERDSRRGEIEDRYRRLLRELEDRCRSSVI